MAHMHMVVASIWLTCCTPVHDLIGMHCLQHGYCTRPALLDGLTLDFGGMFPLCLRYALHIPALIGTTGTPRVYY
jgi:hypothetical protein